MGRYRSRSRSRSRSYSPKRGKRYDDPRDSRSRRDRRSPAPTGLLVRNISLDARPEDLRIPFERFGPIKDIYLPRNYYTGEPRGFGFVKFRHPEDAAEAKEHLDRTVIGGREIRIVFAEENRKTPHEMRRTTHTRLEEEAIGGKVQRGLPRRRHRWTAGQGMTITLHADPYLPRDQFHLMMRETIGQTRSPQGILGPFPGLFLHGVGEITGLATGPQAQGEWSESP
ncbi:SC35-like splicing factor 28 [Actinidia rufa]|uniref:SC35-like splicing factor 28 n=1 Tax=Actinidia rufa TaxID=165716 RepID=A0A7J0EFG6_9ERIC|nr:SC35-like splicing factor 28 [Actinidia rufa]